MFGSNGNSLFHGTTYQEAVEFLAKARKYKYSRSISRSATLSYQDDWSISLVLVSTCVVTYHEDGTYTLNHGGWKTRMTTAYINGHTPFYIQSSYDRQFPGLRLGWTGEKTPARVQKCRMCNGRGGDVYCGRCRHHEATPYCHPWGRPCVHGKRQAHYVEKLCSQHQRSEWTSSKCWRCKGKGVYDYGSRPIPIVWGDDPVRMAADGTILDLDAKRYSIPISAWGEDPFRIIQETEDIRDMIA